jgi:hypothetical protein
MAFVTGQRLTAAALNAALTTDVGTDAFGYCTADTTVNNSATLVNVAGLSIALLANAKYVMSGALGYTSGATPDIKFAFSVTGSVTGWWALMPVTTGSAGTIGDLVAFRDTSFTSAQSAGGSDTLSGNACAMPRGYVVTGGSAVTLQVQFAQNTANASNTTTREGSFLRFLRVA